MTIYILTEVSVDFESHRFRFAAFFRLALSGGRSARSPRVDRPTRGGAVVSGGGAVVSGGGARVLPGGLGIRVPKARGLGSYRIFVSDFPLLLNR